MTAIFTKSCARSGCQGSVRRTQRARFDLAKYCSHACWSRDMHAQRAARRAEQPPEVREAWRRGYQAGYFTATRRWQLLRRRQGDPRQSYDERQRAAVLVTCLACGRASFMTVPAALCLECQERDTRRRER